MAIIRVLAIEDDPAYARLIERMLSLSPIGFHVTVAETMREAQTALREGRFNLILADLNLPDVKGLETVASIRTAEPTLPIVVLTGREDAGLEQRAISLGAQYCLRKSAIDTQNLLNAMHQAVRASRERNLANSDQQVDRLLAELEESITAIEESLVVLTEERLDQPLQDAVQAIRSHLGRMQDKIGRYRQPEP